MTLEAQVRTTDSVIVAYGEFPDGLPPGATDLEIRPVRDDQAAKLGEPGVKTMAEDGLITVTLPPPPIQYSREIRVTQVVQTTDDVALEVFRFPCEQRHLYRSAMEIIGIDSGNFAQKTMDGRFVWKRIVGNAIVEGITVVSDIHGSAAATWMPNCLPDGADVVFTVKGAVGRTINWRLSGVVEVFAPEGLTPTSE